MVGCLLLFCSWSFSTLLLAFSFAGGDVGDNGDDSDNGGGDIDNHDVIVIIMMCFVGLTTGMPLLPSYSLFFPRSQLSILPFSVLSHF